MSLTGSEGMRDNLQRDAPAVHDRESPISDVEQLVYKARYGFEATLKALAYRSEYSVGLVVLLQGKKWLCHFVGHSFDDESLARAN